jgi:simple sugar transport system permease protein
MRGDHPAFDPSVFDEVVSKPAQAGRGGIDPVRSLLANSRLLRTTTFGPAAAFVLTIAAALVAVLPIVYLSGSNAAAAYGALADGSLGNKNAIAETLIQATPLLLSGLAVAVAFHGGLFNIGVEGQLAIGGLAAAFVGIHVHLPGIAHLIVSVAAGMAGGALWAAVPALLKAVRGVHEVVTTIMMNYVAFSLSRYLVSSGGPLASSTQPLATDQVGSSARFPLIWEPTRLHAGFLLALVVTGLMAWFLYRTPAGFRLRLVGANPKAARFHGVDTTRVTVGAMLTSGALAGLAGAVEVLGLYGRYYDSFSPGYGYDAIAVALLGQLAPIGILAAALFFGVLRAGSVQLAAVAGISREMIGVVSALVIGFVAVQPAVRRLLARAVRSRRS